MPDFFSDSSSLSGVLMVSHPTLLDPSFCRSVVLVSSHSEGGGAIGTIINRPLGKTLEEFNSAFSLEPLGQVSLYEGGPVASGDLVFMAWKWAPEESVFRLIYGIDPEQARCLIGEEGFEVRAFLGYAGWGQGQLEGELAQHAWLVSSIDSDRLRETDGRKLWREIVGSISPEMKIQAEAPDDPTRN